MRWNMLVGVCVLGLFAVQGVKSEEPLRPPLLGHQSHDTLLVVGPTKKPWKQSLGQQVTAEGIAWCHNKGVSGRVLLDGTSIYCTSGELSEHEGRLVRISGQLQLGTLKSSGKPNTQGYGSDVQYYEIVKAMVTRIERIDSPYLRLVEEK